MTRREKKVQSSSPREPWTDGGPPVFRNRISAVGSWQGKVVRLAVEPRDVFFGLSICVISGRFFFLLFSTVRFSMSLVNLVKSKAAGLGFFFLYIVIYRVGSYLPL